MPEIGNEFKNLKPFLNSNLDELHHNLAHKLKDENSIFSFKENANSSGFNVFENKRNDWNFDFKDKKHFPEGHSRWEYKGAKFDVYRRGDEYKSQFVRPSDFDDKEFIENFSELENVSFFTAKSSNESAITGINGKIDENVIQGSTGDCWLLSGVYSIIQSEQGRQAIQDSITVNDDSSVTVTFNGAGVSYTLTPEEIMQHDTDLNTSDEYSNGDNDMLVLELATEKLWADVNSGKIKLDTKNEDILYAGEGNGISDGGLPSQIIYYLTGVESKEYYNKDLSPLDNKEIYDVLQNALDSGNTALNVGVYNGVHNSILTDGTRYSIDLGEGGHALSITNLTQNTVTFVNPWDGNTEYKMSWEDFANLGIGYISSSNLDKINYADEIVDMTNYINNGENYFDPEKPSEEDKIKPKPPADEYGRKNHPRDRRLREFETMLARMFRFIQEFFGFEIFK